jgi:hypothetical protein
LVLVFAHPYLLLGRNLGFLWLLGFNSML